MKYNVYLALSSLKPTQKWTWDGTDYSGLKWIDSGAAPTESEINAELTRLTNAEPMRLLRIERDIRLQETDWTVLPDAQLSADKVNEYKTYRQALRDLPADTSDPENPKWPTKPS